MGEDLERRAAVARVIVGRLPACSEPELRLLDDALVLLERQRGGELAVERYSEDEGTTEREQGYRKGWNDALRGLARVVDKRRGGRR
jgi:hypothetical protein